MRTQRRSRKHPSFDQKCKEAQARNVAYAALSQSEKIARLIPGGSAKQRRQLIGDDNATV